MYPKGVGKKANVDAHESSKAEIGQRSLRYFHGHGSIYRREALVVAHVGYSLMDHRDNGQVVTRGHIRGNSRLLLAFSASRVELILRLEDGRRIPFVVTQGQADGITWEIEVVPETR